MSRDIVVQDIPTDAESPADIPDDFEPKPLPFSAEQIRAVIISHASGVEFDGDGVGSIEGPGLEIEVVVGDGDPLAYFSFHDRSSDRASADRLVSLILNQLGLRAFDMDQEDGMFRPVGF